MAALRALQRQDRMSNPARGLEGTVAVWSLSVEDTRTL